MNWLALLALLAFFTVACGPKVPPPYYVPCEDEAMLRLLEASPQVTRDAILTAYYDCKAENRAKRLRYQIQLQRAWHQKKEPAQ